MQPQPQQHMPEGYVRFMITLRSHFNFGRAGFRTVQDLASLFFSLGCLFRCGKCNTDACLEGNAQRSLKISLQFVMFRLAGRSGADDATYADGTVSPADGTVSSAHDAAACSDERNDG